MERPDDSLTPAERAAFAALPDSVEIAPAEEARTILALRAAGLLRGSQWRWILAAAAALAFFLVGFGVGRGQDTRTSVLRAVAGATTPEERDDARNILRAGLALLDRDSPGAAQRATYVVWF
jgi:hypothetical protein